MGGINIQELMQVLGQGTPQQDGGEADALASSLLKSANPNLSVMAPNRDFKYTDMIGVDPGTALGAMQFQENNRRGSIDDIIQLGTYLSNPKIRRDPLTTSLITSLFKNQLPENAAQRAIREQRGDYYDEMTGLKKEVTDLQKGKEERARKTERDKHIFNLGNDKSKSQAASASIINRDSEDNWAYIENYTDTWKGGGISAKSGAWQKIPLPVHPNLGQLTGKTFEALYNQYKSPGMTRARFYNDLMIWLEGQEE